MLTLAELRRAARVLGATLPGHRIQAVVQPDARRVVLTTFGGDPREGSERRRHLLLCCAGESARASLLARPPAGPPAAPAFAQYLRAHVLGAQIEAVELLGDDRQLAIRLRAREGRYTLLLALLGPRSNLWLLDAAQRVAAALRPPAETRPEIALGEVWQSPASRPPGEGEDRFADVGDDGFLRAVEERYAAREREDETQTLARRLEGALRREQRTRERKLEKLARELEAAREATHLERHGELLKGALSRVKRGAREVRVRDHATGEDVVIALDPALSPSENLERLFRRYRKAVRGLTKAGAQEQAVRESVGELAALARALGEIGGEAAERLAALRAFAARPEVARLLARHAPPSEARPRPGRPAPVQLGRQTVPARLAPRRYRSSDGLEIWVGRNDAGNDHLSTRLARGRDLFFHLNGAPGSHVVLRTEGRTDPPPESILEACELAVHFSKLKRAGRADVHVVPIKNVRKPRGAKPGLVVVHGGRTVHLRRIPQRLERVLASRIDD